jgi:predicted DsbA family dithiol-disulfide isomerase
MHIDVYQDIACPWCRIGKRYLQQALDQWDGPVTVSYHPFFLNDSIPAEGYDFRQYMQAKGGGNPNLEAWFDAPRRIGASLGITFHFERITHAPNTLLAHHLVELTPPERQPLMVDALYDAYFEHGQNIGDAATLVKIAGQVGLTEPDLMARLTDPAGQATVRARAEQAAALGVSSVPLFVFNQRLAVSGARPAAFLLDVMSRSLSAA